MFLVLKTGFDSIYNNKESNKTIKWLKLPSANTYHRGYRWIIMWQKSSKASLSCPQFVSKVYPTFSKIILKMSPWRQYKAYLEKYKALETKGTHFQTWRQLKIFGRNSRAGFTKFEPSRPVGPQLIFALLKRMIPVHHFFSKSTMQFRLYACKQMAWEHKEMDSLMQQL